MKITENKLRKIIQQEIQRLTESPEKKLENVLYNYIVSSQMIDPSEIGESVEDMVAGLHAIGALEEFVRDTGIENDSRVYREFEDVLNRLNIFM